MWRKKKNYNWTKEEGSIGKNNQLCVSVFLFFFLKKKLTLFVFLTNKLTDQYLKTEKNVKSLGRTPGHRKDVGKKTPTSAE